MESERTVSGSVLNSQQILKKSDLGSPVGQEAGPHSIDASYKCLTNFREIARNLLSQITMRSALPRSWHANASTGDKPAVPDQARSQPPKQIPPEFATIPFVSLPIDLSPDECLVGKTTPTAKFVCDFAPIISLGCCTLVA